tara:strand:+ start:516 stop:626 length:111 start_codon:yes stop_codon:yes gene_type:complete
MFIDEIYDFEETENIIYVAGSTILRSEPINEEPIEN